MAAKLVAHSAADVLPTMSVEDARRYDANEWYRHKGFIRESATICEIEPYALDPEFVFITVIRDGIVDGMKRPMRRPYALEGFIHHKVDVHSLVWRSEPTQGTDQTPWFPGKEELVRTPCRVYFIACHPAGLVKIGRATDVDVRFGQLQSMSPVHLELLGSMDGACDVEGALHRRWKKHRSHGEWFVMVPEIMEFISEHCD